MGLYLVIYYRLCIFTFGSLDVCVVGSCYAGDFGVWFNIRFLFGRQFVSCCLCSAFCFFRFTCNLIVWEDTVCLCIYVVGLLFPFVYVFVCVALRLGL